MKHIIQYTGPPPWPETGGENLDLPHRLPSCLDSTLTALLSVAYPYVRDTMEFFGFGKKVEPMEEAKKVRFEMHEGRGACSLSDTGLHFQKMRSIFSPSAVWLTYIAHFCTQFWDTTHFHPPPTFPYLVDPPSTQLKRSIGREIRSVERTLIHIEREERKIVKEIQKLAKQGETRRGALTILAKDLVRSRKTREKMVGGKAMLASVQMQIQMQMSTIKVAGCMQKSADVLKTLNALVKIPELSKVCQEMAREMERAGLVEEMVGDAMDSVDVTDEDEVDMEVQKVLEELAFNMMSDAPVEPMKPVQEVGEAVGEEAGMDEEREEMELKKMKERLNAL